jgi:hypothetical protein
MFKSKTLFIVGAGASREIGLPTGAELKSQIVRVVGINRFDFNRQISGDYVTVEALRSHVIDREAQLHGDINPYLHAGLMIGDALPQAISIDNFIDAHRSNDKINLVGKIGIVRCILDAERQSLIHPSRGKDGKLSFHDLSETWFSEFFKLATESIAENEAHKAFEKVKFITFNYDRCIEHFLVQALKNYYGFDDDKAKSIVNEVTILHPYGQTGNLPWQTGGKKAEFGGPENINGSHILSLSTEIKTFSERIDENETLHSIRRCVKEAETIVFLGFAYHPANLELIAPESAGSAKRVFGTAKGMSASDISSVTVDLANWLQCRPDKLEIEVRDSTCVQLFREFQRSLPRAIN